MRMSVSEEPSLLLVRSGQTLLTADLLHGQPLITFYDDCSRMMCSTANLITLLRPLNERL